MEDRFLFSLTNVISLNMDDKVEIYPVLKSSFLIVSDRKAKSLSEWKVRKEQVYLNLDKHYLCGNSVKWPPSREKQDLLEILDLKLFSVKIVVLILICNLA
jgi:hypothetical protein